MEEVVDETEEVCELCDGSGRDSTLLYKCSCQVKDPNEAQV